MDAHRSRFSLAGKTALVTGSGHGLGWEIAKAMAEAGAHAILNGRTAAALEDRVAELAKVDLMAEAACFDVADRGAAAAWFEARAPELDILVNNVGLRLRRPIADCPPDEFARVLEVGLTGAYALARLAAGGMVARGGGAIVNVTSIAGPLGKDEDAAYIAAKGGLEALTRGLAVELGRKGVRCNAIAPGFFRTEANAAMIEDPAVNQWLEVRVPLKRWGEPAEIAGAAVFLASPAASYINGHVLTIDGGLSTSF
ncbi:MAG: SDR family oxidoreductase [Alphaproteobacteria bacterium]|jgi:gluconate 5-dehydrogenase|nr:SDR family oxidoreductase [Alphaproteobacteria bacterium]